MKEKELSTLLYKKEDINVYVCLYCFEKNKMIKTYRNLISLKRHVKEKHLIDDTCPECGKKCKSPATHVYNTAINRKDEGHAMLYAIVARGNSFSSEGEKLQQQGINLLKAYSRKILGSYGLNEFK
jgi:hypothetical protein